MINLLPPEQKEQMTYARRNTLLLNWCIAIAFGVLGILLLVGAGLMYINQSSKVQTKLANDAREQLKIQKLEETQTRVSEISGNLKLAVQVLQRQIIFSGLMQQIGNAIPPGTALTDLRISKLQGGIDLEFEATDYQTATQVQVNLADPANKIFEKADIISIDCGGASEDTKYPCRVSVRALFAKDNQFTVVSGQSGGSQ